MTLVIIITPIRFSLSLDYQVTLQGFALKFMCPEPFSLGNNALRITNKV